MRKVINNGEINFQKNRIIVGNSIISKISGFVMVGVVGGVAIGLAIIGVKGDQWWKIFKTTWYLVGIMLWLSLRYIGAWSHKMVITRENVQVFKRWLFYPYSIKMYPVNSIKNILWEKAGTDKNVVIDTPLVQVTIELDNDEWISVGGVSYPQPGKSVQEGKEIAEKIGNFLDVNAKELIKKKK